MSKENSEEYMIDIGSFWSYTYGVVSFSDWSDSSRDHKSCDNISHNKLNLSIQFTDLSSIIL